MTLRWLQFATCDLAGGLGGVEVHARSLCRELRARGVDAELSSRADDLLDDRWDVVHTHGSAVPVSVRATARAVRVHTLHGTTLGRVAACREWAWPGGYAATLREISGVLRADVVLSVRGDLWLHRVAARLGRRVEVCGGGWDADEPQPPPGGLAESLERSRPFVLFVGRGDDRVKGASALRRALAAHPEIRLVAAPGTGFERDVRVIRTGNLTPGQLRGVYAFASCVVIPSVYEGLSLVLLEALAAGAPVVASDVRGPRTCPASAEGLTFVPPRDAERLGDAMARLVRDDGSQRAARAARNRDVLPRWAHVAEVALRAVESVRR